MPRPATDLDLRRVRFFVEVVRHGGFSQAAKVLFATQSTVSKAVKQLETDLGLPLLERLGSGIQLTDAGRIVHERGVKLLAATAELGQELVELHGLAKGNLRIGFGRPGSSALLARTIQEFHRRFPGVRMDLQVQGEKELAARLRSGELDLVVSGEPPAAEFESEVVLRDQLVALLPATHPLAGRRALSFRELGATPLILFEQGSSVNDVLTDQVARAGGRVAVSAHSSQADLLFELVAAGVGLAFLPSLLEEARPHRHVRALPLQAPGVEWTVRVAWRRDGPLSRAARQWVELAAAQRRRDDQPKVDA